MGFNWDLFYIVSSTLSYSSESIGKWNRKVFKNNQGGTPTGLKKIGNIWVTEEDYKRIWYTIWRPLTSRNQGDYLCYREEFILIIIELYSEGYILWNWRRHLNALQRIEVKTLYLYSFQAIQRYIGSKTLNYFHRIFFFSS